MTVTTTGTGQDARLTLSATAGKSVVLSVTNVTNPDALVYLLTPGGTNLGVIGIGAGNTSFMDTRTLATTGTYTLWIQHSSGNVGSETLQLSSVPTDVTGTITIDGPSVTITTTAAGQKANLTFSGTAGQKIVLNLTGGTYNSCY